MECPNAECKQEMCFMCKKPVRDILVYHSSVWLTSYSGRQLMKAQAVNSLLSGRRTMILNYRHKDWLLISMKKELVGEQSR